MVAVCHVTFYLAEVVILPSSVYADVSRCAVDVEVL